MTRDENVELFLSQSQNSSAKIALLVEDILATYYESVNKGHNKWNRFDEDFYTNRVAIVLQQSSFYFRMIKSVVDRLIDTGVVKYLARTRMKLKYPNPESEPTVLSIDDLMFGFNIWLGFCGISLIVLCF